MKAFYLAASTATLFLLGACQFVQNLSTTPETLRSQTSSSSVFSSSSSPIAYSFTNEWAPLCAEVQGQVQTLSNPSYLQVPGTKYLYSGACQDTVKVCPAIWAPVCGTLPTPSPSPTGAPGGMTIRMTIPYTIVDTILIIPQKHTYANSCELTKAGATWLYNGSCTDIKTIPDTTLYE